jgi:hypothetical protein
MREAEPAFLDCSVAEISVMCNIISVNVGVRRRWETAQYRRKQILTCMSEQTDLFDSKQNEGD